MSGLAPDISEAAASFTVVEQWEASSMSCLDDSLPGYSTGEFQDLQFIIHVMFGAVD